VIYEWDPAKQHANLAKHGIDFVDADLVFAAAFKMTIDVTRPKDEEARFADFAEVDGHVLKLVYTIRDTMVRCISFRVASSKERRHFYEEKNR
jgi:uncharacterized DUF497 family protein